MRRAAAVLLGLSVCSLSGLAGAKDCGKPDLLYAFPSDVDGPVEVPTNVVLRARYAPTAEYLGEDVTMGKKGEEPDPVPATFDDKEGLLRVVPPMTLAPGDTYEIHWPRLAGIGTASRGDGADVTFIIGDGEDTEPPHFDGLAHVEWDVDRERDDCTESLEDRFVFRLRPGAASDDFGTASLALTVFQTKGPDIGASDPPYPVKTVPLPDGDATVKVSRAIDDAAGRVCFAAHVMDLTEQVSGGADHEVCAKTTRPPFFYGCHAARGVRGTGSGFLPLTLVVLALVVVRRHRRPS